MGVAKVMVLPLAVISKFGEGTAVVAFANRRV
jgi:hypothetical protein